MCVYVNFVRICDCKMMLMSYFVLFDHLSYVLFFSVMNSLVYVDIDQGIHWGKS